MEEKKVGKEISFPLMKEKALFGITKKWKGIRHKTEDTPITKHERPKEPILLIIKNNFEIEIREGVPEGTVKITRKLGDGKEEEVRIIIPKSKMLSFPFPDGVPLRGWIADENEGVALPSKVTHDSWEFKRIFDALILNYKSLDETATKYKWLYYIVAGVILLFVVSAFFGMPINEIIFGKPQITTEVIKEVVVDTNKTVIAPIIGSIIPIIKRKKEE